MFPATTNGGGQTAVTGPLDACKTPTPGGPVPMPYPNFGMVNQAKGNTCSSKVKFMNKKVCTKKTELSMSTGDEAGTAGGGVVSNRFKGPVTFKKGSSKVKAEGQAVVHITSMTGHNGNNANVPAGLQVAPSQTKVKVAP
jgi:hypothetical protein